jgi:hypothetical protein
MDGLDEPASQRDFTSSMLMVGIQPKFSTSLADVSQLSQSVISNVSAIEDLKSAVP